MKMEPAYDALPDVTHWVVIKVYTASERKLAVYKHWGNMTLDQRLKWGWYFRYRAARYQVENPRSDVDFMWGSTPKENREEINHINKLRSKKAKITEFTNKLAKARDSWTGLFPIEQDSLYQQAAAKVERLKAELEAMDPIFSHS